MRSHVRKITSPVHAAAAALVLLAALAGCGRGRGTRHEINMTPNPVGEARALLESYAGGQSLGSEREIFNDLVARVTAVDAAKGAALKAFFDDATAKGKVDAAAAKATLGGL